MMSNRGWIVTGALSAVGVVGGMVIAAADSPSHEDIDGVTVAAPGEAKVELVLPGRELLTGAPAVANEMDARAVDPAAPTAASATQALSASSPAAAPPPVQVSAPSPISAQSPAESAESPESPD